MSNGTSHMRRPDANGPGAGRIPGEGVSGVPGGEVPSSQLRTCRGGERERGERRIASAAMQSMQVGGCVVALEVSRDGSAS